MVSKPGRDEPVEPSAGIATGVDSSGAPIYPTPYTNRMSDNEMIVAITSMVITFGTIIVLARAWINRDRAQPTGASMEPVMDRLLRIEQTLDAVAIEVERISEAQRFATRLMAEREQPALLAEGRSAREGR